MSEWEFPRRVADSRRVDSGVDDAGDEDGLTPEERFAREFVARKLDEGTERDPLVRARRAIERLRRIRI